MPATATKVTRKPATKPAPIDLKPIRDAAATLKQASDPTRLQIMLLLGAGETCVGDICSAIGHGQPAVSHHLVLMRYGGIVNAERRGKNNFYSLTPVGAELARTARGLMG
jgi:DNA-binding transcriptional ArsR family regulator